MHHRQINTSHSASKPDAVKGRKLSTDSSEVPWLREGNCEEARSTPCFQEITGTESHYKPQLLMKALWARIKPFPRILRLLPLTAMNQPTLNPEMNPC